MYVGILPIKASAMKAANPMNAIFTVTSLHRSLGYSLATREENSQNY